MILTKTRPEKSLAKLFDKEFARASRELSERGVELLSAGPDPSRDSYYVRRQKTTLEPADFEMDLQDWDEVARRLTDQWTDGTADVGAKLSIKIIEMAPQFESVEQTEDVSPNIYVMF